MINPLPFGVMIKIVNNALDAANTSSLQTVDLTGSQSFILNWLCDNKDSRICQRDIEQRFNMRHPTVSGILKRLSEKDFIEICPDETDRRQKLILVNDKALTVNQQITSMLLANQDALLEELSDSERELLMLSLEKIVSKIKNTCCSHPEHNSRCSDYFKEVSE